MLITLVGNLVKPNYLIGIFLISELYGRFIFFNNFLNKMISISQCPINFCSPLPWNRLQKSWTSENPVSTFGCFTEISISELILSVYSYGRLTAYLLIQTSRGTLYSGPIDALYKIWKNEGSNAFLKVTKNLALVMGHRFLALFLMFQPVTK